MNAPAPLPDRFAPQLVELPETGMGYQVVNIKTKKGEVFRRVVIVGGYISSVDRKREIPFDLDDIVSFEITHDKSAILK
jgi:hypothetical protein